MTTFKQWSSKQTVAPSQTTFKLSVLGKPTYKSSNLSNWQYLPTEKRGLLPAYIALQSPNPISRNHLIDRFWYEDNGKPRASLSNLLSWTKKNIGLPFDNTNDFVRAIHTTTDVSVFEKAIKKHHWYRAIELYRGPFLDSINEFNISDDLHAWLRAERQRYFADYQQAQQNIITSLELDNNLHKALRHARELYKQNWRYEQHLRRYMGLAALCDQTPIALDNYHWFVTRHPPQLATIKLYEAIRTSNKQEIRLFSGFGHLGQAYNSIPIAA